MDGCHRALALHHTNYDNSKGRYSVLVQAGVDYIYRFTDIGVNWPSGAHATRVFANSLLYDQATKSNIVQGDTRSIQGQHTSVFLVGKY